MFVEKITHEPETCLDLLKLLYHINCDLISLMLPPIVVFQLLNLVSFLCIFSYIIYSDIISIEATLFDFAGI